MSDYQTQQPDAADRPLLARINPAFKLLMLVTPTLLITFDYEPILPLVILLGASIIIMLTSGLTWKAFLAPAKWFILLAFGFTLFSLITRGTMDRPVEVICLLGPLRWGWTDILIALALGMRILTLGILSLGFVLTTDPMEFVISLIRQFRLPYHLGYAILAAYRFLPTFGQEMEQIRLAHQVRGIDQGRSPVALLDSLKRYLIPMLATAVRRGERVAIAMEGRGFGVYPERTYWRNVKVTNTDWIALLVTSCCCLIVAGLLYQYGYLRLSLGFNLN